MYHHCFPIKMSTIKDWRINKKAWLLRSLHFSVD